MPIANGFVKDPESKEYKFPLVVHFCPRCYMVQLKEQPAAEKMFHDHYQFISSTSSSMVKHFEDQAKKIMKIIAKKKDPLVIELGSNDGIMLKHIAKADIKHLGVEPSANVAKLARDIGVNVLEDFFNEETTRDILKKYGAADVLCGSNVTCHISDLNSVARGVYKVLKDDGVWFFEDPYMYDIARLTSFDQIYDEHVYFFTGLSVSKFARINGFSLVDMEHQNVHGGSMRYFLKKGKHKASKRVEVFLKKEKHNKLHLMSGYKQFKRRVDKIAVDLRNTLVELQKKHLRVVGYGATSKSTTLLTYAKVGPELIDFISDNTPTKIGMYTPGTHIPVRPHEMFSSDYPAYTVLLAWNHQQEIFKKEIGYRKQGGKFIIFFPRVRIV